MLIWTEKSFFFERRFEKNKAHYIAEKGRVKFLQTYSKQFGNLLLMFAISLFTSVNSLLLAIFYPIEIFGDFGIFVRVLWYSGFGVFLLTTILFSVQLPFYYRKSKECKAELQKYYAVNQHLKIRQYDDADLSEIWQLFYNTVHVVNKTHYTEEQLNVWAPENIEITEWAEKVINKNTVVATFQDKIVGFCDINEHGYINMFYVRKDYIGYGIGKKMFSELLSRTNSKSISVYASVTSKPFFEKLGFIADRENTVERNGVTLTNYFMTKNI